MAESERVDEALLSDSGEEKSFGVGVSVEQLVIAKNAKSKLAIQQGPAE
jgi:hypothetical protein